MEEDAAIPAPSFLSPDNGEGSSRQRARCWEGCGRPSITCICPSLPPSPIPTSTHLIVLHHPHELCANKLATLPALSRSLSRCHPISGRLLRAGSHPILDDLAKSPSLSSPALLLFPTFGSVKPALDLERWAADTPPTSRRDPVLIVFDATWRRAREMAAASMPFLARFAVQVQIGGGCDTRLDGASMFDSELVLRKGPWKGCLSTIEAVARALRQLEPEGKGAEIEGRLLAILKTMVAFQACHLKPMKPRIRLRKKGKEMGLKSPTV